MLKPYICLTGAISWRAHDRLTVDCGEPPPRVEFVARSCEGKAGGDGRLPRNPKEESANEGSLLVRRARDVPLLGLSGGVAEQPRASAS